MRIHLVLPTLNEKIGLNQIYSELPTQLFSRVTVLDGGSTDGTIEWCIENNVNYWIQPRPGLRHGLGDFLLENNEQYDYILTFSPDGNCDPKTLFSFVEFIHHNPNSKLIIGSRYLGDSRSDDDDFVTGIGNRFFTTCCNIIFKSSFTDVFSIYRAFSPELVNELNLRDDDAYLFFEKRLKTKLPWEPLMSFRVAKKGIQFSEFPVGEPPRIGGERKLQVIRWGASFLGQMVREAIK